MKENQSHAKLAKNAKKGMFIFGLNLELYGFLGVLGGLE